MSVLGLGVWQACVTFLCHHGGPSLSVWSPAPSVGRLTCSVPADVSCDEWAFSLLPLDVDLLSMELPEFFRDYFLVSEGSLSLGTDRWGHMWGPMG